MNEFFNFSILVRVYLLMYLLIWASNWIVKVKRVRDFRRNTHRLLRRARGAAQSPDSERGPSLPVSEWSPSMVSQGKITRTTYIPEINTVLIPYASLPLEDLIISTIKSIETEQTFCQSFWNATKYSRKCSTLSTILHRDWLSRACSVLFVRAASKACCRHGLVVYFAFFVSFIFFKFNFLHSCGVNFLLPFSDQLFLVRTGVQRVNSGL